MPSRHTTANDVCSRFFATLATDKPIQRGSWDISIDEPLFETADTNGIHSPQENPSIPLSRTNLRVDWQTQRRLPLSGAVAFNFKCLFTPIASLASEPYIPGLLASLLKEGKREAREHKGAKNVEHVVVPALEEMERKQKEKGIVDEKWEAQTLQQYPWFPGWEDKWQKEQGFA